MIYWCEKCSEPVFDKKLHELTCKGKLKKLSEGSICNPVFVQERKLLSKIVGEDLTDKKVWYFGSSRYLYDGEIQRIPYIEWYKNKSHLKYADELRNNIEIERDYTPYMGVVKANEAYIKGLVYEAEKYIVDIYEKYSTGEYAENKYIPTVSFSGGKDSTVVSRLVRDALQDNSIVHFLVIQLWNLKRHMSMCKINFEEKIRKYQ